MAPTSSHRTAWNLLFGAWLIATSATLGALFLGEIMKLPTCVLCWWQRICMFPLPVLLGLGLLPHDPRVVRYALPFAFGGLLIGLYHQAIVLGWVSEALQPCQQGVPCSKTVIEWFGFLTIPLLSIAAFAAISALLLLSRRYSP
jgi:disulfide bond formation protein DsbB